MTFLNLFNRKKPEEKPSEDLEQTKETEDVVGSVTFYVRESKDDIFLDLHISNYEDETLEKFAKILAGLASIKMQLETINMLKGCFEDDEVEVFEKIIGHVITETQKDAEQLEKINKENKKGDDQPWIKPSEIVE